MELEASIGEPRLAKEIGGESVIGSTTTMNYERQEETKGPCGKKLKQPKHAYHVFSK